MPSISSRLEKTMTKKWSDVRRKHAPEVEARIRKEVKEAANVMTLHQLREARQTVSSIDVHPNKAMDIPCRSLRLRPSSAPSQVPQRHHSSCLYQPPAAKLKSSVRKKTTSSIESDLGSELMVENPERLQHRLHKLALNRHRATMHR